MTTYGEMATCGASVPTRAVIFPHNFVPKTVLTLACNIYSLLRYEALLKSHGWSLHA
jgi:hypothetical protein